MNPDNIDRRKKRGWWILAILASLIGVWYLHWRITYTLNTEDYIATAISITIYGAEVYGFLSFLLFFLQVRQGPDRTLPPVSSYPSVDVFVTVYTEPVGVLYRTLVCCQAMEYPGEKTVYVLDDGNRKDVKDVAEKLKCVYLSRPTHENAKAGNVNYALSHSMGDIVAIFDCDHIPVKSFLLETVPYFEDPDVAIVQTPHYFYNPDSFQRNLKLERELAHEQDLFFRIIEPGRDYYNASFFAGSSGLFRRKALDEIGGIQTITITEDLHTSMVLHARGYKSVYVPRILSAGLSPESFEGYLKQRKRWTRGGIQVFILDNPLFKRGLSFWQRIQYFASIFYFFHGIPRLLYLSGPLSYLIFGYAPLKTSLGELSLHFIPYYVISLIAFHMISQRLRNPFWSDVYETAMCFSITLTAIGTILNPKNTKFHVTPKGLKKFMSKFHVILVLPHLILMSLLLLGISRGFYQIIVDNISYLDAFRVSVFWGIYNMFLLVAAISTAFERKEVRSTPRLRRMIPGKIIFDRTGIPFVTSDISESGISLTLTEHTLLPLLVKIHLHGDKEYVTTSGMVMRNDFIEKEGITNVGIHFLKLSEKDRQAIIRMMFSSPYSWYSPSLPSAGTYLSLVSLMLSPLRLVLPEKISRRLYPRIKTALSCEIRKDGMVKKGVIEDISYTGAKVRVEKTLPMNNDIILKIYDSRNGTVSVEGRIAWKKTFTEDTLAGIHFLEHNPDVARFLAK